MLGMLVAYNAAGAIVEVRRMQVLPFWLAAERGLRLLGVTIEGTTLTDLEGERVGLADFEGHEAEGGALADYGRSGSAVGSATWPEWLRGRDLRNFDIEFEPGWSRHTARAERPDHRIAALVHKASGHRRERADLEAEIAGRIADAHGEPADIRDLVGGPDRPLLLDDEGRTTVRPVARGRSDLPLLEVASADQRIDTLPHE